MKLDDLIAQNGGTRPAEHWECPEFLGGCGECWATDPGRECEECGHSVMHVVIFKNEAIKLRKLPRAVLEPFDRQHDSDSFVKALERAAEVVARAKMYHPGPDNEIHECLSPTTCEICCALNGTVPAPKN